ncbi:MAG: hypothetical protein ACO3FE_06915, partial [Planctomycetaceae bacterium]
QAAIDEVNGHFSRVGQIRKFAILPQPLSIDTGELTHTLKVKRNVVAERLLAPVEDLAVAVVVRGLVRPLDGLQLLAGVHQGRLTAIEMPDTVTRSVLGRWSRR